MAAGIWQLAHTTVFQFYSCLPLQGVQILYHWYFISDLSPAHTNRVLPHAVCVCVCVCVCVWKTFFYFLIRTHHTLIFFWNIDLHQMHVTTICDYIKWFYLASPLIQSCHISGMQEATRCEYFGILFVNIWCTALVHISLRFCHVVEGTN
jgi:hypothetical protein